MRFSAFWLSTMRKRKVVCSTRLTLDSRLTSHLQRLAVELVPMVVPLVAAVAQALFSLALVEVLAVVLAEALVVARLVVVDALRTSLLLVFASKTQGTLIRVRHLRQDSRSILQVKLPSPAVLSPQSSANNLTKAEVQTLTTAASRMRKFPRHVICLAITNWQLVVVALVGYQSRSEA